jgi:hypothetical protein
VEKPVNRYRAIGYEGGSVRCAAIVVIFAGIS